MKRNERASSGRAGRLAPVLQTWFSKRRAHRGQALVELAMVLPIMLVLFASALDLGRLYYSQITIDNAAKEGALEAARDTENLTEFDSTRGCDAETNRVICLVINEAKGSLISVSADEVSLVCNPDPCPTSPVIGDTVAVTVSADFMMVSPILSAFFDGQTIPISATSTAQIGVDPHPGSGTSPTPTPSATPTPTPTPMPTPTPGGTPTPTPTPSPTPLCATPSVGDPISISPGTGKSAAHPGGATTFTMTAPTPVPQPGCSFTFTWSFGDGLSGTGAAVTHQYQSAGSGQGNNYTVTLVISTQNAPTWQGTKTVKVT